MARVVVADDEADLRTLLRFCLGSHPDFEVVGEAGDGEQVVDAARRLKPDLLILDIQMPKKSGLEALPEILRFSPDTKVIVFSCLDGHAAATALARGADAYIEKGFGDIDYVLEAACRLTDRAATSPPLKPADEFDQKVRLLRLHQQIWRTYAGLVRDARNDGIGDRPRKGDQGMETRLETQADRGVEPGMAGSLRRYSVKRGG